MYQDEQRIVKLLRTFRGSIPEGFSIGPIVRALPHRTRNQVRATLNSLRRQGRIEIVGDKGKARYRLKRGKNGRS